MKILRKRNTVVFTAFLVIASIVVATILVPKFLTGSSPLDRAIDKTFIYEATQNVVPGLYVELFNENGLDPIATGTTDTGGNIVFDGLDLGTYTIKWMWGGGEHSEVFIVDSSAFVFSRTNVLQSKSGGGLHLAEELGLIPCSSHQVIEKEEMRYWLAKEEAGCSEGLMANT